MSWYSNFMPGSTNSKSSMWSTNARKPMANSRRANGAPKGAGGAKGVASRVVLRSYQALVADSVILSQSLQQQALAGANINDCGGG